MLETSLSLATKAFLADSIATLLINTSFGVQKLGHREVEGTATQNEDQRAHCKSPTWWLGMAMMLSGVLIHICAIPYVDLALISANSSLAIIANLMLSIWLFNEKFVPKYDLTATIMIILGAFFIVLLANKEQ